MNSVVRVLLVDDDEDELVLTRYLLAEIQGTSFELDWVAEFEEALQVIEECRHDVYLLDFRLGLHTGLDLMRAAQARGCKGPFLLLTGQGQRELDLEAMQAGAADYLEKGQLTAALLERSIRYAREQRRQAETLELRIQERTVELAESQRFLRSVLDSLPSHIAVLQQDGTILAVNEAWRKFGEANGLVLKNHGVGENYLQLCEPVEQGDCHPGPSVAECIREVITGKRESYRTEYPCHSPEEQRWFQMRVTRFPGNGPVRVVVAHEDITPRVLSELAVRRRSEQLQELARIATHLTVAQDLDAVVQLLSEAARQILGARHAVIQLPEDPDRLSLAPNHLRRTGIAVPLIGRGGRIMGVLEVARKIEGEWTADDEAIIVQLARMASVALENTRLYQDLRETDRLKDEFLAMLAHELRNPLAPIRNALYLVRMQQEEQPEHIRQAYAMMDRQLDHLVRLVDDLLDVSRITRGKINLQKERVDLATVVSRALESSRPLVESRGHHLEITFAEEPLPLDADPVRLSQVFLNLLNNAAKYTPRGGRIWLSVEREGPSALVRIRDNGIGIPAAMLSRIFDLFTQVDRTIERTEGGLGIGLTLVRRLTEMHGGTVQAYSAGLGQGSEFVLRLPLAFDPPPRETTDRPRDREQIASRRILIVDDNRDSANSLAKLLQMLGHEVQTAADGMQALRQIGASQPEIVILDLGMPGMTGFEVARHLRQMKQVRQPLLIALTGFGTEEDRRMTQEAGFDAHLVKPVDLGALQMLVQGRLTPALEEN